jgi:hypothetical protein
MSDEGVDLLQLFQLDSWRNRGQMVESVEITFRQLTQDTEFQLFNENEYLDTQTAWGHSALMVPGKMTLLGVNTNSLSLWVQGGAVITKIAINLSRERFSYVPPGAPQQVVYLPVDHGQSYGSQSTLDLASLTGMNQYRGFRVHALTVLGRSLDSYSNVQVLADSNFIGTMDFNEDQVQNLYPNRKLIIGQNLNRLRLLMGSATRIEWIELRISRY